MQGNRGLQNALPERSSLWQLSALETLWVSWTLVAGAIPEAIARLRSLRQLEVRLGALVHIQREIIYTPPPFLAKRHFPGEGGGGVYFEAPRGRNFIRPPLYTPPPQEGIFRGGGWGRIKFGPVAQQLSGTKKKQPKEKFLGRISRGRPRIIRADVPGQKFRALKTLENKHFGADIHDPSARTSMTPGGCKKTSRKKPSG